MGLWSTCREARWIGVEVRGAVGAGQGLGEDWRGLGPAWGWWEEGEVPPARGGQPSVSGGIHSSS